MKRRKRGKEGGIKKMVKKVQMEKTYSTSELKAISKYLESTMPYNEFNEFFHLGGRKSWPYFESILDWLDKEPYKAEEVLYALKIKKRNAGKEATRKEE